MKSRGLYRDYQLRYGPFRVSYETIASAIPVDKHVRFHASLHLRAFSREIDRKFAARKQVRERERERARGEINGPHRCIVTASPGDNTIADSRTRPMGRGGQSAATISLVGQPDLCSPTLSPGPFSLSRAFSHLPYIHNHKTELTACVAGACAFRYIAGGREL